MRHQAQVRIHASAVSGGTYASDNGIRCMYSKKDECYDSFIARLNEWTDYIAEVLS